MKRQLATALALTLATAFANPASATAMYFADVFAEVIITDIPTTSFFVDLQFIVWITKTCVCKGRKKYASFGNE